MPKYKVTMEYSFQVIKEVEAPDEDQALVAYMDEKDFIHQMWSTLADGEHTIELVEERK